MAKVHLEQHDPDWANQAEQECRLVWNALAGRAISISHIGSTAISGIVAKPIIDLLVEAGDIDAIDQCNDQMLQLGYEAMGEFGVSGRRYFRKDNKEGIRTHHVHVFEAGSQQITRHTAFRDFMRAHPLWAYKYSQLKLELAGRCHSSAEYQDGKNDFIQLVDTLAAAWLGGG